MSENLKRPKRSCIQSIPGHVDREQLGDELGQLAGDVVEHVVVLRPLGRRGVQVEAGAAPEVVGLVLGSKMLFLIDFILQKK
jgi:hypothetical protein